MPVGVRNVGQGSATGQITIRLSRLDGTLVHAKTLNTVPGGARITIGYFHYPWPCPSPGTILFPPTGPACPPNFRLVVDALNAVAETNESNNILAFCSPPDHPFTPQ